MTGSEQFAARPLAEADDAMRRRKILLVVHVALTTTATTVAARRALMEWDGPPAIRDAAIESLDRLGKGATP